MLANAPAPADNVPLYEFCLCPSCRAVRKEKYLLTRFRQYDFSTHELNRKYIIYHNCRQLFYVSLKTVCILVNNFDFSEKHFIMLALRECNWSADKAAQYLNMRDQAFNDKLKEWVISERLN